LNSLLIFLSKAKVGKICSIEGCNEKHLAKGYCGKHYREQIRKRKCSVDGCSKKQFAKEFCYGHYFKQREKRCTKENCSRPYHSKGFCKTHYDSQKIKTDPEYKKKRKEALRRWAQRHPNYFHNWWLKNKERETERRFSIHEQILARMQKWRDEHVEESRQFAIDTYQFLREECIRHYSNEQMCCARCKEDEYEFLTVDHIQSRKNHGHTRKFGSFRLYRTIYRENFPSGYQILCYTCNMIKEFERRRNEHLYSTNKDAIRENRYSRKLKQDVMEVYCKGKARCQCCGFDNIDGLSIDHINEVKNFIRPNLHSKELHKYLKRNIYPKGFQVLCINCNSAKGKLGKCPHDIGDSENS